SILFFSQKHFFKEFCVCVNVTPSLANDWLKKGDKHEKKGRKICSSPFFNQSHLRFILKGASDPKHHLCRIHLLKLTIAPCQLLLTTMTFLHDYSPLQKLEQDVILDR